MFEWELLEFTQTMMRINLIFAEPLYISFSEEPDILQIIFADEELFVSENDVKIKPQDRIIRRALIR